METVSGRTGSRASVSRKVDSVRPIRTRRFAPACAKAFAVSRPMPLPLDTVSYGLFVSLG